MSARPSLLAAAACLVALFSLSPGAVEGSEASSLTILHTNDMHARVEPVTAQGSACTDKDIAANACFGGWARMIAAIREERGDDTILLDAGDQFQGSLFYTHYKGADTAEFMTLAGYDAMAVGNHEFDDGPEVLARFAKAVPFPLLSANLDLSREPALEALIKPSAVIRKGGMSIGVIGLTPEDTGTLTLGNRTVGFLDPVEAVRREVAALTAEGIEIIILLSHSGYGLDQRIAASVEGLDAIVGGHSHTILSGSPEWNESQARRREDRNLPPAAPSLISAGPYPTLVAAPDGQQVPVVQAGSNGLYFGRLDLVFGDTPPAEPVRATGGPILLDAAIPEDPAVKARVSELVEPLDELRSRVVAETAAAIDGARETCRTGECQMGTLVADAMLGRVADQGVQIAIANGGGLRASIDEGGITMGEVLTVLPFQNTLSTFTLKGAELVAALENGVSKAEEGSGRFPQVAGIEVDWSMAGTPGTDRIRAVRVRDGASFVPLDPSADYRIVSNNFLRGGGDGYAVFAEEGRDAYDYGPTLDAVLVDYLTKQPGAYEPRTEGRIRLVD